MEGRRPAKGNEHQGHISRTQGRSKDMSQALERIRLAVRRDKKAKLTALNHHVYNIDHLREAYWGLNTKSAPGVDGETWEHYGQDLEVKLEDLSRRVLKNPIGFMRHWRIHATYATMRAVLLITHVSREK